MLLVFDNDSTRRILHVGRRSVELWCRLQFTSIPAALQDAPTDNYFSNISVVTASYVAQANWSPAEDMLQQ